jgi:hypothetical protein
MDVPPMPDTAAALARVERDVMTLPPPAVPLHQEMPTQETQPRKRRGAAVA